MTEDRVEYGAEESGDELLERLGDDARLWAREFCKRHGNETIDESVMFAWFASAIEYSHEIRMARLRRSDDDPG
jgi:hypothetical protein